MLTFAMAGSHDLSVQDMTTWEAGENFWSEICNLGVRCAGGAQYSQKCNYCM